MHLLLEGDRGSGKSTLILETVRPYLHLAGGFGTTRLLDEANVVQGYAQIKAAELEQVNQLYQGKMPGIFVEKKDGHMISHPEVMMEHTLPLLKPDQEVSFYLLDEIGGVELLMPEWQCCLKELFSGDTPSIGVWKSPDNCEKFCRKIPGFEDAYWQMREWLLANPNVRLLQISEENREAVAEEIQKWKKVHLEKMER